MELQADEATNMTFLLNHFSMQISNTLLYTFVINTTFKNIKLL